MSASHSGLEAQQTVASRARIETATPASLEQIHESLFFSVNVCKKKSKREGGEQKPNTER